MGESSAEGRDREEAARHYDRVDQCPAGFSEGPDRTAEGPANSQETTICRTYGTSADGRRLTGNESASRPESASRGCAGESGAALETPGRGEDRRDAG